MASPFLASAFAHPQLFVPASFRAPQHRPASVLAAGGSCPRTKTKEQILGSFPFCLQFCFWAAKSILS
ncbi:hypothetical protein, partial [Klebsiella variicola]|uniref:hypothetical protein n=1 Tax=Klebsiella variicola TaxID=244366 RepID=UPI0027305908